jgi:predicted RNase H-like HicB family nuclease
MRQFTMTVAIEQDEDGRSVAICPALQGCYTEGETEAEALEMIEDAMRLHLEDRIARQEPVLRDIGTYQVSIAV